MTRRWAVLRCVRATLGNAWCQLPVLLPADIVEAVRRLEVGQQELAVKLESKVDALASMIESG